MQQSSLINTTFLDLLKHSALWNNDTLSQCIFLTQLFFFWGGGHFTEFSIAKLLLGPQIHHVSFVNTV